MVQDARKFQYSSDYPQPYFVYKVSKTVVAQANQTFTLQFEHEQGFIPLLVGYWSNNSSFSDTTDINTPVYGDDATTVSVEADETYVYITGYSNTSKTIYIRLWGYTPPDYDGESSPISDSTKFNFNTDYNYLEIAMQGKADDHSSPNEVTHNLGYVPQCRIWRKYRRLGDNKIVITPQQSQLFVEAEYANNSSFWATSNILHIGGLASNGICYYYHIYTSEG